MLRPHGSMKKEMVILGARYVSFSDEYVSSIDLVESIEDPENVLG